MNGGILKLETRKIILGISFVIGLFTILLMLVFASISFVDDLSTKECHVAIKTDKNTLSFVEDVYKLVNLTQSIRSFNDFPKGKYDNETILICSVKVFYYETGELNEPDYYEFPVTLEYYEFPCYSKEKENNNESKKEEVMVVPS